MPALPERKTYFILPTSDYGPQHIKLGQIITSIRLPYRPLSPPLDTIATPLPELHKALRENYTFDHFEAISGNLGVQAQFLAQLGSPLSGGGEVSREKGDILKWTFDRLETEFIEPTQNYVEDSVLRVPEVKKWLNERKLTGAVYMVTGIKIARGGKFFRKKTRAKGVGGDVTVDLTALTGTPVGVGPTAELEKKSEVVEAYSSCSDFVWAYRMQRIHISWLGGGVKAKEKVGGDLAGVGGKREKEEGALPRDEDEPQTIDKITLEQDLGSDTVPNGFIEADSGQPDDTDDIFLYSED